MLVDGGQDGAGGEDHDLAAGAGKNHVNAVGALLYQQERYAEALPILEVSLELRLEKLGEENLETAETLNSLGILLSRTASGKAGADAQEGSPSRMSFSLSPSKNADLHRYSFRKIRTCPCIDGGPHSTPKTVCGC